MSSLPTCPYCAGPLLPDAYCTTCRMTVAPYPGIDNTYPGIDNSGYLRPSRSTAIKRRHKEEGR